MRNKNTEINLVGDGHNDLLKCSDVLNVSKRDHVPWNVHIKALAQIGAHRLVVAAHIKVAVIEPMQLDVKHSTSAKMQKKEAICYYIIH